MQVSVSLWSNGDSWIRQWGHCQLEYSMVRIMEGNYNCYRYILESYFNSSLKIRKFFLGEISTWHELVEKRLGAMLKEGYVCAKSLQLCLTLCNPLDCSSPGSSVNGVLQAITLEWVAMPSSRGSFWLQDGTWVSYASCVGRHVL